MAYCKHWAGPCDPQYRGDDSCTERYETVVFLLPNSVQQNVCNSNDMNVRECVSDCRSRGREFDPGPVPYFRGD